MDSLTRKIVNLIEQKQVTFRGLKGLRLTELKKVMPDKESGTNNISKAIINLRASSGSLMKSVNDSIHRRSASDTSSDK